MATTRRRKPGTTVKCELCGNDANTNSKNVAKKVTGWITNRSGGGANHIRYAQPTGAYAHIACLGDLHEPVKQNQAELF